MMRHGVCLVALSALLCLVGCDDDAGDGADAGVTATLTLTLAGPLQKGDEGRLTVERTDLAGETTDVTAEVTWAVSDPRVLTIEEGAATAHFSGVVTVTATLDDLEGEVSVDVGCPYPASRGEVRLGQPMPSLAWPGAYIEGGAQADLVLKDVHCGADYAETKAVVFAMGAAWCGTCNGYMRQLAGAAAALVAAGAVIVYLEYEDAEGGPISNLGVQQHLVPHIGDAPGFRVGDAQTFCDAGSMTLCANFMNSSGVIRGLPTVIVVRTSDMQVIADSNEFEGALPLAQIVADPEADW